MKRLALLFALPLSLFLLQAQAQRSESPSAFVAVKADLLNSIHAQGLKAGGTFFIRTDSDWQEGSCTIRAKTLITGVVAKVELRPHHVEWALNFDKIPCAGSPDNFRQPLLIALEAVHAVPQDGLQHLSTAGLEDRAMASMFSPARPGYGAPAASGSGVPLGLSYAGFDPEPDSRTGEVRGLRGTTMRLPSGDTATTLVSTKSDISIDRYATFTLTLPVASRSAVPTALASVNGPTPSGRPSTPTVAEEPADLCAAATCSYLSAAPSASTSAAATWTVSLASLGIKNRPGQMISALERSASILPLGEDELLLTFATHTLVHRGDNSFGRDWKPLNVRGVVLSRTDGRVLMVRDWTVSDDLDSPVWSMGNGHVIAHVGKDLVDYGPDLKEVHRVHLSGPVLFLSASAAAHTMLLATVHEKHTAAEHEKLSSFLEANQRIDEDYDLTGLDEQLNVIGTQQMNVEPIRPALLAGGMVEFKRLHGDLWQLVDTKWGGKPVQLARLHSGCEPEVASLAGGLLDVRGCVPIHADEEWYDVLDAHGTPLLKGKTGVGELLQQTETSQDGRLFAVAVSNFDHQVHRGDTFTEGAFKQLTLSVYANPSGRAVLTTHLPKGSAQEHTFCLTPQGDALIVLTGETLQSLPLSKAN